MTNFDNFDTLNFMGYDLSPLPLDFTNEVTTTKWLGHLLAKLNKVLEFSQSIYKSILKDLEEGGTLYKALTETFGLQIKELQESINQIEERLKVLEYKEPIITIDEDYKHYRYGEKVNGAVFKFNISNNSNPITAIELYKDGELVNRINSNISENVYIAYTGIIVDNSKFTIKVSDDIKTVEKNILYQFNTPLFYSAVNSTPTAIEVLNSFTKFDCYDSTSFTVNNVENKQIVILSENEINIYDENSNLITDSFTKSTIDVQLDIVRHFNLYMLNNSITVDKFKFIISTNKE